MPRALGVRDGVSELHLPNQRPRCQSDPSAQGSSQERSRDNVDDEVDPEVGAGDPDEASDHEHRHPEARLHDRDRHRGGERRGRVPRREGGRVGCGDDRGD